MMQNTTPQNTGIQHIQAGKVALQQGKPNIALSHYIAAIQKSPENHRFKIHLCEFLKNVRFPNHEPSIQKIILQLLNTNNLDHQCLWQAWLSLLLNDPEMIALQNLMDGKNYNVKDIQDSLENNYFIKGLEKLFCANMAFENAIKEIKKLIDTQKIFSKKFNAAFDIYNERTENLLTETADFSLNYTIDQTIPSLSKIKDKTSQNVQDQYEQSPYPRWTSYHLLPPPTKILKERYSHLIAGCGTGFSTCMTSVLYPHADITAFDLSRASLTYAKQKILELKLKNITLFQADILDLKDLDKKFDLIECSGVLHHMKDPVKGWRCLLKKLAPKGKMHIGLYSELGRADVVAARQFIDQEKFDTTPTGIRKARNAIANLPSHHPARQVLNRRDFYNLSGCRDLIFHVQEHRFTISQLSETLHLLGLVFDGFTIDNAQILKKYTLKYPDDPMMTNLENWHLFEKENSDSLKGMYQFWCHPA